MMKVGHPSKLRVLLIALIFSAVMISVQARPAHAENVEALFGVFAAGVLVTYATVMGVACTPIAAAKASDYPGGFFGAYGDCFTLKPKSDQTTPAGKNNDASDKPAEDEHDVWYLDND